MVFFAGRRLSRLKVPSRNFNPRSPGKIGTDDDMGYSRMPVSPSRWI